ncbi:MAG: hypothetical protein U0M50_00380, partial [Paramuribaculum sp.]
LLEGEQVVGAAGMVLDVGGEKHSAKIRALGRGILANLWRNRRAEEQKDRRTEGVDGWIS